MAYMTEDDVHEYIQGICGTTGPPGKVGVETEWLVADSADPSAPVSLDRLRGLMEAVGPPPGGSSVTFEPGGQIELSSPALRGPARTHEALSADMAHVRGALAASGLSLVDTALDPYRPPRRQLQEPRYTAMERFFTNHRHASGHTMMCSTASLQVCLDVGADAADARERWELLHRLGPVLVAAFANSSFWRGRPTGWKSTRWAIWAATDATRTRPVLDRGSHPDPATAWAEYALAARVLAVPDTDEESWLPDPGITLAQWIEGRGPRPVTRADLAFHLSTLFPPVRPRGWWELRMVDAVPGRWWPVPMALTAALADDPRARAVAQECTERLCRGHFPDRLLWRRAAQQGMADPDLARCARVCFDAAAQTLARTGAAALALLVDDYADHYTRRGLSPADTRPPVPAPRPVSARHGGLATLDSADPGGTR